MSIRLQNGLFILGLTILMVAVAGGHVALIIGAIEQPFAHQALWLIALCLEILCVVAACAISRLLAAWIIFVIIATGGVGMWRAYHRLYLNFSWEKAVIVTPMRNFRSEEEIGYIDYSHTYDDLSVGERTITWRVEIPATNDAYLCTWERGYADFKLHDNVIIIHSADEENPDDDSYLVGLHGEQNGVAALVHTNLDTGEDFDGNGYEGYE